VPGFRSPVTHSFDSARSAAGEWASLLPLSLDLTAAAGGVLAEPLRSLTDLPAFRTAAMDGWAVAGPGPWRLTGQRVLAGSRPADLADGAACEIATGAMLPASATGVLRREDGDVEGRDLCGVMREGLDCLPAGGECAAGDELLPAGTLVTPPVVGMAAAAGHSTLSVRGRAQVALLVLGDELLSEGRPADGRVRDSLGPQLPGWVDLVGGQVSSVCNVPDDLDATVEALGAGGDVVLSTGGTAAGPVDHLHKALAELGAQLLVDGVAVRPGHPMLLARLADGRPVVGLPGNPLSACVGVLTLLVPLLDALRGIAPRDLPTVPVTQDLHGRDPDSRLVPVRLGPGGATPVEHVGSAMLRGLVQADAVVVVPPAGATRGDELRVMHLPWWRP
jgi:molybdopterin molybdotransferase